jgi:hypothetical protein
MAATGGGSGGVSAGAVRAGQAFVELRAQDGEFNAGLDRARARLKQFGEQSQHAFQHLGGREIRRLGIAGAGFVVGEAFIKSIANTDELNERLKETESLSAKIAENMRSGFGEVLKKAGESEGFNDQFKTLADKLAEAEKNSRGLESNLNRAKDAVDATKGYSRDLLKAFEGVPIVGEFAKMHREAREELPLANLKEAKELFEANRKGAEQLREALKKLEESTPAAKFLKKLRDEAAGRGALSPEEAQAAQLIAKGAGTSTQLANAAMEAVGVRLQRELDESRKSLDEFIASQERAIANFGKMADEARLADIVAGKGGLDLDPAKLEQARALNQHLGLLRFQQVARELQEKVLPNVAALATRGVTAFGGVGLQQQLGGTATSLQSTAEKQLTRLDQMAAVMGGPLLAAVKDINLSAK